MLGRSEGANSRSIFVRELTIRHQFYVGRSEVVNTNLRELVPTRCYFKKLDVILMTCYYIMVFRLCFLISMT